MMQYMNLGLKTLRISTLISDCLALKNWKVINLIFFISGFIPQCLTQSPWMPLMSTLMETILQTSPVRKHRQIIFLIFSKDFLCSFPGIPGISIVLFLQAVLSCLENVIRRQKDDLWIVQAFIGRRKVTSLFLNSSKILSGMV